MKVDRRADLQLLPCELDAHDWAREQLPPGSCYWVIRTSPDGRSQGKAELYRLPQLVDRSAGAARTLDDMAADIAREMRETPHDDARLGHQSSASGHDACGDSDATRSAGG